MCIRDRLGKVQRKQTKSGEGEGLPHPRPLGHQQPATLPQCPPDPNCVAVPDDQLGGGDHYEEATQKRSFFKP